MIEVKLTKLMNSTPVGYLTGGLWITKGGKVLPIELNEFAEYELTPNPNPESINLDYNEYERLTYDYLQSLPKRDERLPQNIEKHLAGKHDQSTHAGNRRSVENPSFSDDELDAISAYTGSATVQINHKLRGLSRTRGLQPAAGVWIMSDDKMDKIVSNLDSAIAKSQLSEPLTLSREMPINSIKTGLFGSAVGKTISDKGFLSLRNTQDKLPARNGFVKLIVKAPAGTKALDMSFINQNAMGEIIFPRGTKIKINSVRGQASDVVVRGEIVE